jgi:hypothetical protein
MMYHAVGNKCAVSIPTLGLPLTTEAILSILGRLGFQNLEIHLVDLARSCIGQSRYERGTDIEQAPKIVDCSSFMKWLYAQMGIWLPRYAVEQKDYCPLSIEPATMQAGDLVFRNNSYNFYTKDSPDGVGHVGMATGDGTVIHASKRAKGVIEVPYNQFTDSQSFRGIKRILLPQTVTLICPAKYKPEHSLSLRWIILQTLPSIWIEA